jgi:hypothetical protein
MKNNQKGFANIVLIWQCDNILTTIWLDCPHGSKFWAPTK